MHRVSKYWFFALLAAFCTFPTGAAPLRVTLESNAIVTSGVQPQGRIVLFGLTREIGPDEFPTVRRHLTVLGDAAALEIILVKVAEGPAEERP